MTIFLNILLVTFNKIVQFTHFNLILRKRNRTIDGGCY